MTRCMDCGSSTELDWHLRCKRCFIESEKNRVAALEGEVVRLQARVAELEGMVIDHDFLKALLQLAHPDRHGGSALATETTKRLLAMRGRVAEAVH